MKKVYAYACAAALVALTSCGGNKAANEDSVVVEDTAVEVVDSTAEGTETIVAEEVVEEVAPAAETKAPAKNVGNKNNGGKKEEVKEAAKEEVKAAEEAVVKTVDEAKKEAVNAAKDAAASAKASAKDKANKFKNANR